MSLTKKGNVTLDEFRCAMHETASQESFASRFVKLSMSGDRRGMIEMLMEISHVTGSRLNDSCEGKDDIRATSLYEKLFAKTMESDDNGLAITDIRRRDLLTKALFAASANSRLFLDILCERARRSCSLRAYANCLRDCECMLALPASFYDGSAENVKYFMQRRKECLQLERECTRKMEAAFSKKCGAAHKRKTSSSSFSSSSSSSAVSKSRTSLGKGALIALPTVDGKRHNRLASCSDSVMLRYDETKGRHLVATRDIRPGTVLIVDQPFSYSTDASALDRNCLHCHATFKLEDSVRIPCRNCQTVSFCTETCRKEAWERYHQYECSIFDYFFENSSSHQTSHLLLAYRTTVLQAITVDISNTNSTKTRYTLNSDFLQYHINDNGNSEDNDIGKECADLGSKKFYSSLDYRTVFKLESHCADTEPNVNLIRAIEAIFFTKYFMYVLSRLDVVYTKEIFISLAVAMLHHLQMINCNAYEIIENVYDETTRVWEPRNIGGAIYATVSLVNHSCYPNVVRHSYANGMVVVRALRCIDKGCEILDCYGPHFLSTSRLARRELLWKKYRFLCTCDACTQNWTFPSAETTNYKCTACSEAIISVMEVNSMQKITHQQCTKCKRMVDLQKIEKQLHKSIQKRLNAITKMYQGNYRDAMPLLFEHMLFVNKHLAKPNIEGIKTEQCIVQCYNSLGSVSV